MEPLTLACLLITSATLGVLITLVLGWRKERITVEKLSGELKAAHLAHNSWAKRLTDLDDKIEATRMILNGKVPTKKV